MAAESDIAVLIVSHNTCSHLRDCLTSLHATGATPAAIAVCDNASSDGTTDMVKQEFPGVQLIENARNVLYAEAVNQLSQTTEGRFLLLLNPDTQPDYSALHTFLDRFQATPRLAAVAPQLVDFNGHVEQSCRRLPTAGTPWLELLSVALRRPSKWKMSEFDHTSSAVVEQPMFSAILVSRAAWKDIGALDPSYPLFFNDVDWCHRAAEAGWSILFDPTVSVKHLSGGTTRKYPWRKLWHSHKSFARYLWRTRTRSVAALAGIVGVWSAFCVRAVGVLFK